MSVLYYCYCGYTQREPDGAPAPHCREAAHLAEPRVEYPTMLAVVVLPAEHLAVVRLALTAYRDQQDGAGESADSAAAALEALGLAPDATDR